MGITAFRRKIAMRWLSCSVKKKYWCFAILLLGIFLATVIGLCGGIFWLLGETDKMLEANSLALEFQLSMEEENRTLRDWASEESSGGEEDLEISGKRLQAALATLEEYGEEKLGQSAASEFAQKEYQQIWSIQNSCRVYWQKRAELVAMGCEDEKFVETLYDLYDMQNYLTQYGTRLNDIVSQEESRHYQERRKMMEWIPVFLIFLTVLLGAMMVAVSRLVDRLFIEPILQLSKDAKRIAKNDFEGTIAKRNGQDEIGELVHAFEKMKQSTADYIGTLKENSELQIQLEKVQLKMLKSQVNPHFL